MIFKCIEFGDREFTTKEQMFDALLKHQQHLISLKKAAVHKSHEKGQFSTTFMKIADPTKAEFMKEGFIYPVINTTNYMDSHKDVHFNGIWKNTLKDNGRNGNSLMYVMDHELKISSVISWPSDVNPMTKIVPWSFVGKDYPGNTEALIYEIEERKISNLYARNIIDEKKPVQNSVRMLYVKITLAINDERKEFKENKAYYDSKIALIANKEVAEEEGHFWGIEEAKIIKEGSMVLAGSNDATPIQYPDAAESTTGKTDPQEAVKEKTLFQILAGLNT